MITRTMQYLHDGVELREVTISLCSAVETYIPDGRGALLLYWWKGGVWRQMHGGVGVMPLENVDTGETYVILTRDEFSKLHSEGLQVIGWTINGRIYLSHPENFCPDSRQTMVDMSVWRECFHDGGRI